jgi:o-succinylbenzoate synthase
MKIDQIVMREIRMPLKTPFETSFGVTTERRIILIEIRRGDFTGWGECVAGEHPFFNEECTATAWPILAEELIPRILRDPVDHAGQAPQRMRQVRGNRMAKAALENALWDLESQERELPLARLLGGMRDRIACGVSIGIKPSVEALVETVAAELASGYQRIKLKVRPGLDREILEPVRARWPHIMLSCDANSAYRLRDLDHLATFDDLGLLMIEQPLWADDFYYHSLLQERMQTAICLDESIRNRRDALAAIDIGSCRIINIKLGRVGGFSEAIAVHNACEERGIPVWCGGMLESGIGRSHNIALSALSNFQLPGDVSASARYWKDDIIEPPVTVSQAGEIEIASAPGRGYEVREDLVKKLTVRHETFK